MSEAALAHQPEALAALAADGALTVPEACTFLGISRASLYRELRAENIRFTKRAGRTLILRASLRAWLAAGIGAPLEAAVPRSGPQG